MSSNSPRPEIAARFDRHARLLQRFGMTEADGVRKFLGRRVLLLGNARTLGTRPGRLMLLTAANLISRFYPKIDVSLPDAFESLGKDVLQCLGEIDGASHADFRIVGGRPQQEIYAAVLSVGPTPEAYGPTVTIESAGWLAAVSKSGILANGLSDPENPFGALMAASFGTAEVFKHLLEPLNDRAFHFDDATFSVYDYRIGSTDPGPRVPLELLLPPCLLAGVGAVGNAICLTLSQVRSLRGRIYPVDRQSVDFTNLNRYGLAVERDADAAHPLPKTSLVSRAFKGSQVQVEPFQQELEQVLEMIYGGRLPRPEVVLSAVDNNEAREALQLLWPTLLLDGSTSETLSQAFRYQYGKPSACLMCIHTPSAQNTGFSYTKTFSELSGLPEDRVRSSQHDPGMVITEQDVGAAPQEKREFLRTRIGKTGCSVLSELERFSDQQSSQLPIEPAVSFVSMNAGILVAGELIKWISGMESPLQGLFQIDSMFPLANSLLQPIDRVATCYCAVHEKQICEYRARLKLAS